MDIKSSETISLSTRTTSISIGDSRSGKTYFVGTMCDSKRKVFILDTEGGLETIKDKKFSFCTVNTWDEAKNVLDWYMMEGYKKFEYFVIDSLNRLQTYLIDDITDKPDEHGKNRGIMTINKFGILSAKLKKVVDVLTKKCPSSVHFIVTAAESKDEVTGATRLYPAIQGSFKFELLGYMDTILYHRSAIDKEGEKFWCQIGSDSRVIAGTRIKKLKDTYGTVMPNSFECIAESLI